MPEQTRNALILLREALDIASEQGALDYLLGDLPSPDSVNALADAVGLTLKRADAELAANLLLKDR